jgi:D-aminoacyl-tRNA deacylase
MKAVVQRVIRGKVTVEGKSTADIQHGLVVLLGIGQQDGVEQARWMADKIATLRIFEDDAGKMNRSVQDIAGSVIVISQFTLYGDARKGRRPSFFTAAAPDVAAPLVDRVVELLTAQGVPTQTGIFGAHMLVEIHNDGPVTILLEN